MRVQFFLILLAFCLSVGSARADDGVDALKEPELVSELYTGQTTFTCNGHVFKIPSYFPYRSKLQGEFYLVSSKNSCNEEGFKMILAIGSDCGGQNICTQGSFSVSRSKVAIGIVGDILENWAQEVQLSKGETGYYIPSKCYAYCNQAKLIWFEDDTVYIIGTKFSKGPTGISEDIEELKKAYSSMKDKKL